ncbi:class I SAM-dependent methyltransferase [Pelagicoccus sp. SDUM812002]|uniref:class I SAM-dependent methyltransferase n=1 Tax=Pelagicoccus sp. SDUM812002 TaxID=3041266 RepID=UPI00280F6031|nr:class I SAM-dependent methyltransferase [Pelagicoccus sp. SDUM812002]MDQ8185933.1 class I SAM-dependent methyltransferase [Pelagicoccus sp. SDUM812002]
MSSFDQLAELYEPLERLTFASRLQDIRRFCLPFARARQRGLLIGDGDGRFSAELLASNPDILIDSIDLSPRMQEFARRRAGDNSERLESYVAEALEFSYPTNAYDFIGLHFVLDCFDQDSICRLLPQLEASLKDGGLIAYSDFQANKAWQRFLVKCLYFCFRVGAGLKTQSLPTVNWSANIQIVAAKETLGGLVFSQVLEKKQPATIAAGSENR